MTRVLAGALLAMALVALAPGGAEALRCPREPSPQVTRALRSPGDRGYRILVSGQPDYYVPEAVYTLSLLGSRTHGRLQMFSRFLLTAEPADPLVEASPQRVGTFQLFGDSFTGFHDDCINTVAEANDLPKTEVQAMWTAPPRGSGCVVFRAMVLENVDNWWADEGALSLRLCELPDETVGARAHAADECCSCDEAKYKLVFEGLWSNTTHPKDFPFSLWLTHFSDVIGGSHERNFTFWGEGQVATDGLRMVAEWGSVRGMEQELRASAKHLRSLIKAGGLWYPNVNANTSTTFRVDQRRPQLSIVSMLGPTPDWIVGVSGLDLCQRDCSWVEHKTVDLYPYDAGTDNGISYMSPNSPTIPRERVRRITTMYPEDPRAPFYNPGGEMLPLARLYLVRDSVTPRPCGQDANLLADLAVEEVDNVEDTARPECAVTEYSEWSPCSVSCGKGLRMRQRSYLNPDKAAMLGCGRQLLAKEMCVARAPSCPGDLDDDDLLALVGEPNEAVCATTEWGSWSECSVSCGTGEIMRSRQFIDRMGFKKCPQVELRQKDMCKQPECRSSTAQQEHGDTRCPVTEWADWSPCSASCGKGLKLRTRLLLAAPELQELCSARVELVQTRPCEERRDCRLDMATAKQVCMMEVDPGPCRGYFERWYFEVRKGMCVSFGYGGCRGNRNNFMTEEECRQACSIMTGGPPPHALSLQADDVNGRPINCVVSQWRDWSPCSNTCGRGTQLRERTILVQPSNNGKPCPKRLVRKKKCHLQPCEV